MSHILKALSKAARDNQKASESVPHQKIEPQSSQQSAMETIHRPMGVNYQFIFMGILMGLVGVGIYLNYNIFQHLVSTQNRMSLMTENLKSQQDQLNKINTTVVQIDSASNGQTKEFLAKLDRLSIDMNNQIQDVKNQSQNHHQELSSTITNQDQKIDSLMSRYDQLDKSLNNFTTVNSRYIEQLNIIKKKITELKYKEASSVKADN